MDYLLTPLISYEAWLHFTLREMPCHTVFVWMDGERREGGGRGEGAVARSSDGPLLLSQPPPFLTFLPKKTAIG